MVVLTTLPLFRFLLFVFATALFDTKNGFFIIALSSASLPPTPLAEMASKTLTVKQREIVDTLLREYEAELAEGFATFGKDHRDFQDDIWHWRDEDFHSFPLGKNNGGPSEDLFTVTPPNHGSTVFQTKQPVLSAEECKMLIAEARQIIDQELKEKRMQSTSSGGTATTTASNTLTNSDLGEARVSKLPQARAFLQKELLHKRLFPLLSSRFGLSADDLTLQDSLIIGYGYLSSEHNCPSQPVHRDSCLLSLNIALSPPSDYQGGGTYFEALLHHPQTPGGIVSSPQGHAVTHASGVRHAGRGIRAGGQRWVLVLFVLAKNQPELARRAHAHGMHLRASGDAPWEEAVDTFSVGLSMAPRDHSLWTSLGGIYHAQGQTRKAQACLARAAAFYQPCTAAHMALGRMHWQARRPRAALRRYAAVLEWLQTSDVPSTSFGGTSGDIAWQPLRAIGYEARISAAQAALVCAQTVLQRQQRQQHEQPPPGCANQFDWRYHVQKAIDYCHICVQASPDQKDERIPGMLAFAQQLLSI